MKAKNILVILLALTLVAAFGLLAQQAPALAAQASEEGVAVAETAVANLFGVSETGLYIVQFKDPSLASYTGGIAGLAATSPEATGARKLDANSPASRAYLQYLTDNQTQFAAELSQKLDRSVEVAFNYTAVLNAIAIAVSHEEAAQIAAMPGVAAVYGDTYREIATDVGPALIGAPAIWNGNTGYGVGTRGEGIIIGVIDSGINSQHPSFAATDGDGYTHTNPYGAGAYTGWCVANPSFCNAKLIGAYNFHPNGGSPEDTDGHGSHTASTAGGNAHIATFNVGNETYNIPIQGVAPRANIVAYKVCDPTCPGTSSVEAVQSAILNDDVDVLNYSISGVDNPWLDAVDLAFLDASNAGIFVSASAGNAGPGPSTVAKTGPWNASVAASTHNRAIGQTLDVTSQGEPAALQGLFVVPGEGTNITTDITSGILYDATNNLGCTPFAPGTFTGNLALIQRGGCTFAEKATNAQNAGATGVVLFQSVGGPPITAGGNPAPPLVMMDLASGIALRDHVLANPTTTTVRINAATSLVYVDEWEDIVAGFSSRGPSQFELLKPDYIAPGVNILAAVEAGATPAQYGFLQGTSMSSPHGAGAGALMMALHPTWSPAEIRSAMATTAITDLFKEDGMTPADPFDIGSGRLDLSLASTVGLVFNETGANYAAANPAIGGDPKTLNQPSVVNYNCTGECTWTREVKSTLPISATYTASFSGPAGMTATVTPSSFTIPAGGTQVITITADVSALTIGEFAFGSITLSTGAIWPDPVLSGAGTMAELLNEQFTDTTFPPADWAVYKLAGAGTATWIRDTAQSLSAPASARRIFGGSADGNQDDWLVTPALTLDTGASTLTYYDRGQWMTDYGYSGVWVSADSCDPADGDFVQLLETADIPNNAWRATPVTVDLSAYAGQEVCLAFRYGGDFAHTWWIDDVVVTSFDASVVQVADTNIPVVVVPALAVPVIDVDPDSLSASQPPDQTTSQTLAISNNGGVDLDWEFSSNVVTVTVPIWNQPANGTSGIVSDFFIGSNAGAYSASDFVVDETTDIAYIFAAGFDNTNTLSAQPAINWAIYADSSGVPAGHPEDGTSMGSALWAYTAPVNGPGVDITGNDIALDLLAAGESLSLTPGTYWLTVYPSYNVTGAGGARWNWYQAAQVGAQTHLVSPIVFGIANWSSLGSIGVTFFDTAFRIEAPVVITCEHPDDVAWLAAAPTMATTAPAGTTNVTVTFDSTGLAVGEYSALLCVESNDPAMPLVEVQVTLEVIDLPVIEVDVEEINATQAPDEQTTHTVVISNTGESDLNWYFEESEGITAGPVPAAARNLPVGADRAASVAMGALAPTSILPTGNAVASSWSEGFDDITLLPGQGWAIINNSSPAGTASWFQGNAGVFPAHSGATNSYIGVNFNSVAGANTISNWLLTPEFMFNNGDSFSFWTRTGVGSSWPDRLEVRWSGNGASTDVGTTATSVGDFDTLLLSVNPGLTVGGYPEAWTQFTVDITGLSGPTSGRLAFRYFVTNGGPSGSNSNYIGIDTFEYVQALACDNPSDVSWISVDPASGMTAPGDSSSVEVTLDSTGVLPGEYTAYLCLNSNDPTNPLIEMPVNMTVEATSYLRVAHLAPFAMDPGTAVTVTLNGAPALTDFAYGDSTTYIELPSGEYDVAVWPAGSASPAITATVELEHGMYYSAIAYGDGVNQDLGLMLLEDDNTAPAAGKFHLRLGHLAPFAAGLATADIRLEDGTLVVGDVDFTDVTGYIELDAGEYDLKITTPGGDTTLINPRAVTFSEGDIVTAFATGEGTNQDLGVFAWPVDVEGFFLPLGPTQHLLFLPIIMK